jgi:hypothetical protein
MRAAVSIGKRIRRRETCVHMPEKGPDSLRKRALAPVPLWCYAACSSTRAGALTHVSWIMSKLAARDRAQLVVTAYETGLVRAGSR